MSNELYTVPIERDGGDGSGIAYVEGMVTFVPFSLAGEQVRIRPLRRQKRHMEAELVEVLAPSPLRRQPFCPHYMECGGCAMQHIHYDATLAMKRDRLADCLRRIGGVSPEGYAMLPPVGMEEPYRYRNKAVFPIENGEIGFYKAGGRSLCPINECHLLPEPFLAALHVARELLRKQSHPQYRSLMLRQNYAGECIAVLSTRGRELPHSEEWMAAMRSIPAIKGFLHGAFAPERGEAIGKHLRLLYGMERLPERIGDVSFFTSAQAFEQVNRRQAEALFDQAVRMAGLSPGHAVLDAYCGIGALTQRLAAQASRAVGVELGADAILGAKEAALANGATNIAFEQGACEDALPRLKSEGFRPDIAVLDPPRKGCDPKALQAIAAMDPGRIVYISCDPATLGRDVKLLTARGYRLKEAAAVDMFPWTRHVECVILLTRTKTC